MIFYKRTDSVLTSLDKVSIKKTVYIEDIIDDSNIKTRLLSMGIVKGSTITPIFSSPLADPIAYETEGMLIALRKEEAKLIKVICK